MAMFQFIEYPDTNKYSYLVIAAGSLREITTNATKNITEH